MEGDRTTEPENEARERYGQRGDATVGVTERARVRRGNMFEFSAKITERGRVDLPADVAEALAPGQVIRVFLVLHHERFSEDELWGLLGAHQLTTREE